MPEPGRHPAPAAAEFEFRATAPYTCEEEQKEMSKASQYLEKQQQLLGKLTTAQVRKLLLYSLSAIASTRGCQVRKHTPVISTQRAGMLDSTCPDWCNMLYSQHSGGRDRGGWFSVRLSSVSSELRKPWQQLIMEWCKDVPMERRILNALVKPPSHLEQPEWVVKGNQLPLGQMCRAANSLYHYRA